MVVLFCTAPFAAWITLHCGSPCTVDHSLDCGQKVVSAGESRVVRPLVPSALPSVLLSLSVEAPGLPGLWKQTQSRAVLSKLLPGMNSLGWGFEGVPYGCLLTSLRWD